MNQLELYGIELGAVVHWEDADGNKLVGCALDAIEEEDGYGHYLKLLNNMQGIDEVPMSLVQQVINPNTLN